MKKLWIALLLLVFLVGCAPPNWNLPDSLFNLRVVAWYEREGHQVFHVRHEAGQAIEYTDLLEWAVELVGDRLEPDHGLYIVIEEMYAHYSECALVIGVAYGDPQVYVLIPKQAYYFSHGGIWPSWVDDYVIVTGYAWLLGLHHEHPWFPELASGRPLPLDSKFFIP